MDKDGESGEQLRDLGDLKAHSFNRFQTLPIHNGIEIWVKTHSVMGAGVTGCRFSSAQGTAVSFTVGCARPVTA
jgi:hypothetical protein